MDVRAKTKPWGPRNGLQSWETGLCWDRSEEDYKKKFCFVESSQEHLASIILNGWSLKQSGLFLDLASWPNWAIEGEGSWLERWSRHWWFTLVELHDLIWRWEKLAEWQTSLRHSTNLGLMAKWPKSSFSSVKIHETLIGIYHWSSPSNMTITRRPQPRQCRSGLGTTLWTSSSGPARAGTWNQSDIFGETYKWLSTDGPQPTWQSLRWSKEKNGKKTQMQMCKACCIIPKKTWGFLSNCCQSALTKFWVKGMKTCAMSLFQCFLFNKFAKLW